MNDEEYVYNAIDYLSAALDNNKKEKMIDELLGDNKPIPGAIRVATNGTIQWTDGNAWQEMTYD